MQISESAASADGGTFHEALRTIASRNRRAQRLSNSRALR